MAATYVAPALPGFRAPRPVRVAGPRVARPRVAQTQVPALRLTRTQAPAHRLTRTQAPALRLTRRGRLAILAVALLVVLLPGAWRAVATAQIEGPTTATVTVQAGDTLWGLAQTINPGADPRALIAEIRELNGLAQSGLTPGQVLVIPAG